jgi:hypothetical protein
MASFEQRSTFVCKIYGSVVLSGHIGLAVLFTSFIGCSGRNTAQPSLELNPYVSARKAIGAEGYLSSGGENVAVAIDEATLVEWMRIVLNKDEPGGTKLMESAKVFAAPEYTRVLVLDNRLNGTQVQILEKEFAGRVGWVYYEWVK